MRAKHTVAAGVGFVVALFAAFVAVPEEAEAQHLAQVYEVKAKQGAQQALESALERHAEWREKNGDPWEWDVYEVVQGKHVGSFLIRSPNHNWSDFDDYDEGFGPKGGQHYQATVAPLVKSTKSYIVKEDTARSHVDDVDPSLIELVTFKLRPGGQGDWMEPVKQFHDAVVEQDYPIDFVTVEIQAGAGASHVRVAYLHENWADFKEPDQSAGDLMQTVYGEEEASKIYERYTNSFTSTYNMVIRPRPDLSVEPADEGGAQ